MNNSSSSDYIVSFIDFFESSDSYYLVMEYIGDYTLSQFVNKSHKYIQQKRLKLSEYKKTVKFLFWYVMYI